MNDVENCAIGVLSINKNCALVPFVSFFFSRLFQWAHERQCLRFIWRNRNCIKKQTKIKIWNLFFVHIVLTTKSVQHLNWRRNFISKIIICNLLECDCIENSRATTFIDAVTSLWPNETIQSNFISPIPSQDKQTKWKLLFCISDKRHKKKDFFLSKSNDALVFILSLQLVVIIVCPCILALVSMQHCCGQWLNIIAIVSRWQAKFFCNYVFFLLWF